MKAKARVTHRDPTLAHQIVLLSGKVPSQIDVSCNCLQLTSKGGHKSMGTVSAGDLAAAWAVYDDPSNHSAFGSCPVFVPGERSPQEVIDVW